MRLYCNETHVVAIHGDDQDIDPALYGAGIDVLVVREGFALETAEGDLIPSRPVLDGDDLLFAIKRECRRRIYAVASPVAQQNMSAVAAAGLLDAAQLAAYRSGLAWIAAMRANVATLAGDDEQDFTDAAKWPAAPAEAVALAAAF